MTISQPFEPPKSAFIWPVRVYYEDTDAGGVVYHSNYLNFMERARTEWLRNLGFEQPTLRADAGVVIVVHRMAIEFKAPAKFNDMLEIHCEIVKLGHGSLEMAQKVMRNHHLLVKAEVGLAFVHADSFKPVAMPQAVKHAISATLRHL